MSDKTNIHKDHRRRMKEQVLFSGLDGFSDYTLLEFILFYAIPQGDTNPLAHRLIDSFGSINRVFDATFTELMQIEGVGEHTALLLTSFLPLMKRYCMRQTGKEFMINDYKAISDYVKSQYVGIHNEKAMLISFDSQHKFINSSFLSDGSFAETALNAKTVISAALKDKASFSILVHNHPSGNTKPSHEDIISFRNIKKCLLDIDVELSDNIIISGDEILFFSQSPEYINMLLDEFVIT